MEYFIMEINGRQQIRELIVVRADVANVSSAPSDIPTGELAGRVAPRHPAGVGAESAAPFAWTLAPGEGGRRCGVKREIVARGGQADLRWGVKSRRWAAAASVIHGGCERRAEVARMVQKEAAADASAPRRYPHQQTPPVRRDDGIHRHEPCGSVSLWQVVLDARACSWWPGRLSGACLPRVMAPIVKHRRPQRPYGAPQGGTMSSAAKGPDSWSHPKEIDGRFGSSASRWNCVAGRGAHRAGPRSATGPARGGVIPGGGQTRWSAAGKANPQDHSRWRWKLLCSARAAG